MHRAALVVLGLASLAAAGVAGYALLNPPAQPAKDGVEVDYPVGEFRLTERSGQSVTRDDLLGKVWVAAFVFTRCAGPCSQVSGTMARLQKELPDRDDVRLVSF